MLPNQDDLLVGRDVEKLVAEGEQMMNSLGGLVESINLGFGSNVGLGPMISQDNTLFNNCRWYLISNLRQLLSQLYVEHGLIQTLVDQPVDDGFRAGFEIKTGQLDSEDIEDLKIYCERSRVVAHLMQAIKWARLYGGGGVMIITDQDPKSPLDIEAINEDTPLEFRSVDMWELYYDVQNTASDVYPGTALGESLSNHFDYYGRKVHKSRVYRILGKEPPSFIKPRLRGWGMSELERVVRSLNQYLKNQDVIFELLDEAKVDVHRIKGFNDALIKNGTTQALAQRIQAANMIKNYNHALVMDSLDEYDQKQITFSGLADVLNEVRQGIACDLKMPLTKLFGVSAAGFNSGEDDIENYNSMIEGEIRAKNKFSLVDLLTISCRKVFSFTPDDLMVEFNPLRILNAKEEEEVKDSQFARVTGTYSLGLMSSKDAKDAMNKDALLGVELDPDEEATPPLGMGDPEEGGGAAGPKPKPAKGGAGKQTPKEA